MYFEMTYNLTGIFQNIAGLPTFAVPGNPPVSVTLGRLEEDPLDRSKPAVLLTGAVELKPPKRAAQNLRELKAESGSTVFEDLSGSLQEFSQEMGKTLRSAMVRTIEVIRWRFNVDGPPNPHSSRGIRWSEDGEEWHMLPTQVFFRTTVSQSGVQLGVDRVAEVEQLLSEGIGEPLAHVMLREAKAIQSSYPVSGLIMGMAAAEVGVKQLISALVPDTAWLVENLPSPSLYRILNEYLADLPIDPSASHLLPLPSHILDAIRKGTSLRNSAAHVGQRSVDHSVVMNTLSAVEDLLWTLDACQGLPWASEHIGSGQWFTSE